MLIWFVLLAVPFIIILIKGSPVDSLRLAGKVFYDKSDIIGLFGSITNLALLVVSVKETLT